MNLRSVLFFSAAATCGFSAGASINHDTVQPLAQPEAVTVSEKAAVSFKPKLQITSGCHPYPAVNAAGETSAGLKGTGFGSGGCKDSDLGSQIYGRSSWYSDRWAIMYAWYFPKDKSRRHSWANIVVWLDNPAFESPSMIGLSTCSPKYFNKYTPPRRQFFDGPSLRLGYREDYRNDDFHTVDVTSENGGDFQDLVMWDQLTDQARAALNEADFGEEAQVPFNDANFEANLKLAWLYPQAN